MKHIRLTISALLLLTALVFAGGSAVYAEQGTDDSGSGDTTSTSNSDDQAADHSDKRQAAQQQHQARLADAKQKAEDRQQNRQTNKQQVCESHKQGLANKFSRIYTNALRAQTRIDEIYAKAQAYQQDNNVTVDNWTELTSAADSAQTTAAASVAALKDVTPSIDCNSTSVKSDVQNFKTVAAKARSDLKAYKQAVKAVLQALRDAKQAAATQTPGEGSDQ